MIEQSRCEHPGTASCRLPVDLSSILRGRFPGASFPDRVVAACLTRCGVEGTVFVLILQMGKLKLGEGEAQGPAAWLGTELSPARVEVHGLHCASRSRSLVLGPRRFPPAMCASGMQEFIPVAVWLREARRRPLLCPPPPRSSHPLGHVTGQRQAASQSGGSETGERRRGREARWPSWRHG